MKYVTLDSICQSIKNEISRSTIRFNPNHILKNPMHNHQCIREST